MFTGKPKLKYWYEQMKNHDEAGSRVYEEINSALQGWDESGRWEKVQPSLPPIASPDHSARA